MRAVVLSVLALTALVGVSVAEPPVATVGARAITRAELEKQVKPKLVEIESQRYEALSEGLNEMVADELFKQEAKARGISMEALEQQEITGKLSTPTDAEIQKVYDDNKEQLGDATLESVKPRIVEYLQQTQAAQLHAAFIEKLKGKYKTTINLRPPMVEVSAGGSPERGPKNAPITIIEFSDYECPFCKRAEASVQQVLTTYGDKVRFVYRNFPLPMHKDARPAAEAALCANAQGKFWEYHAKLFASSDLSKDKLQSMAAEVGLDRGKFDACFDKTEFTKAIDKDVEDGSNVGVNGTPAFFINGRMLSGAQPFEKFKEVIDDELAHAKNPKS